MARKKISLVCIADPQAYVAPAEPCFDDMTGDEIDALSDNEYGRMVRLSAARNLADHGPDHVPGMGGVGSILDNFVFDDELDLLLLGDDWEWNSRSETEKAAAPIIERALVDDLMDEDDGVGLSEERRPIDLDGSGEAVKTLLVAVWVELRSWRRRPKPEVIAKVVGLAIATARGERGLKHPRDLAKEVGVRYQTFNQVLGIANAEIDRLGLGDGLKKTGTYNEDDGEEQA